MSEDLTRDFEQAMSARHQAEERILVKAWEDATYKQKLLQNPTAVITAELGSEIPNGCTFEVIEEQPNTLEIVLPRLTNPVEASEELSNEALEEVAGGAIAVTGGKGWNTVYAYYNSGTKGYVIFVG